MAAIESKVQIAPESSGPKIRNLRVRTIVDGVPTDVEMQVICIADENGHIIADFHNAQWQESVLIELRRIRKGMSLLVRDPLLDEED